MALTVVCAWCGKQMGTKEGQGVGGITHGICVECLAKEHKGGGNVPHQERIDPVERKVLELTARTPELKRMAATIIEEGADLKDFAVPPGRRPLTLFVAIAIRALRPPFRLPDSMVFGRSALWDIEH